MGGLICRAWLEQERRSAADAAGRHYYRGLSTRDRFKTGCHLPLYRSYAGIRIQQSRSFRVPRRHSKVCCSQDETDAASATVTYWGLGTSEAGRRSLGLNVVA